MIKSVSIKNFQSHKDTKLEFDKGISMIAGSSNSGKSAILRAVRWVILNKPNGDTMVSHWALDKKDKQIEDTSVTIEFDNVTVTRSKGKDGNIYKINDQVLEAFGMDVPEEVVKACNFNETNLQAQLDSAFLLSDTGGEVARFLNKIVKLDKIDSYLAKIEQKKRKTKSDLDLAKDNLVRVEKDLIKYEWVERAGKLFDRLASLETKCTQLQTSVDVMKQSLLNHTEATRLREKTNCLERAIELKDIIAGLISSAVEMDTKAEELSDAIDRDDAHKEILANTALLPKAEQLVARINKYMDLYDETKKSTLDMEESLETYTRASSVLETFDNELVTLQGQLPSVCPTCGKPLKECDE